MQIKQQRDNSDNFNKIKDSIRNTPDWKILKNSFRDEFPVLITGNMRKGRAKNDFLEGCNYYGPAITFDDNFIMKKGHNISNAKQAEPFVFVFEKGDLQKSKGVFKASELRHVEGDIYGIPLRKLAQIDKIEGNNDQITRIERWVTFRHPLQEAKSIKAFIWTVDLDFYLECFTGSELELCRHYASNKPGGEEFVDAYYHSF